MPDPPATERSTPVSPLGTPPLPPTRHSVNFQWNWWPINRPQFIMCDPYEGTIILGFGWGNGNSDPVWMVDVQLVGLFARPFVAWADRRWDAAVARQNKSGPVSP